MAIEESSAVAAALSLQTIGLLGGGFKATVINTEKIGQVHFYKGRCFKLELFFFLFKQKQNFFLI
jgi:hydroxymethylglutaryl-CoA reductase